MQCTYKLHVIPSVICVAVAEGEGVHVVKPQEECTPIFHPFQILHTRLRYSKSIHEVV